MMKASDSKSLRIAYMMSRFPKVTETFVLNEMLEMERQGYTIEVYPLQRENAAVVQAKARDYVERAHFTPFISWPIFVACLSSFVFNPLKFMSTLLQAIYENLGSRRFLVGAIAFFPKAIYLGMEMKKAGIAHVRAHFASHPAYVACVIHRMTGIPYSFVAHGSDLHRDQHMLRTKAREAAFVVAISQYNKNMIVEVSGSALETSVHVIHCGIDPQQFWSKQSQHGEQIGDRPVRLICVGTLHEVKGQHHLLDACALLVSKGIGFECAFLGDGPDRESLEAKAEVLGLSRHIRFLGSVTSDIVHTEMQAADILVAPSAPSKDGRREGIPVVLMEAMAAGTPCISSRLSGIPELIQDGETGMLTDPGNASQIAEAIGILQSSADLRRKIQSQGLEKIKRDFSLKGNVSKLATLILSHHATKK